MKTKAGIPAAFILALACILVAVPASADTVAYDNAGPGSYTTNAWSIFGTSAVTDSFTLSTNSAIDGANFYVWVLPGDSLNSVTWSITDTAFGSVLATGTATSFANTQVATAFGTYPVLEESISIPDLTLGTGTYWLQLSGGQDAYDNNVWWDESDGASAANSTDSGPIPSETFQIIAAPEPSGFLLLGSGMLALAGLATRKKLLA